MEFNDFEELDAVFTDVLVVAFVVTVVISHKPVSKTFFSRKISLSVSRLLSG